MKKLNYFSYFDWPAFAKGKIFVCTGCNEWTDHDTKAHLGTRVTVAIVEDLTDYGEDTGVVTNLYEKLDFKVGKDISVPIGAEVQPKNVQASIYGDYRNQLSCRVQDIAFQLPKE